MTTYRIEHIADLLHVPPEDMDECMRDIGNAIAIVRAVRAAAALTGAPLAAVRTVLACIDFTPDGAGEITPTLNGREMFTVVVKGQEVAP